VRVKNTRGTHRMLTTPTTIVTDKLRSYVSALRELGAAWIGAARFLSTHAAVYNVFNIQRHLISRGTLRVFRNQAMLTWRQATVAA
jgi:putative transposase